jgi:hypothetical protein
MNILEFTETRIVYSIDNQERVFHRADTSVAQALEEIAQIAQILPNDELKVKSVSIIKRKGNKSHEIFL